MSDLSGEPVAGHDQRQRGLPSLQASREQRRRAIVLGKVRLRDAAPNFWLWTLVLFVAFGVVYWHIAERQLRAHKSEVMARQRALVQELEPHFVPVRDRVEAWVAELADEWKEDYHDPSLTYEQLMNSRGIYLRLLMTHTDSPEAIRRGAEASLHDGFTSCLFVRQEGFSRSERKPCTHLGQCPSGELCNDYNVCSPPSNPFNLRMLYRAMRVLSPVWVEELHAASDEYQVRVHDRDLQKATEQDVPLALRIVQQARYATILLDELPEGGLPPPSEGPDAGVLNRPQLRVQLVPHPVRVGVWDLESGKNLLKMRTHAGADFVPIGRMHTASRRLRNAQQRQVNNCSIATEVRSRLQRGSAQAGPRAKAAEEGAVEAN